MQVLKFLAWGFVVLILLLSALVAASYFLSGDFQGMMAEGEAFAVDASRDECLDEVAARTMGCTSASCIIAPVTFGAACFSKAAGDAALYCDAGEMKPLPRSYCDAATASPQCSEAIVGVVAAYCRESNN